MLSLVVFEESDDSHLEVRELDVFLGKNYLVTHHDQPLTVIDRVWSSCQRDERHVSQGADHLLYRLVDEVVAQYMPVVEAIDDEIDIIQAEIFTQPGPDVLSRVFSLKRGVLQLRGIVGPMRVVLNKLARDDFKVIDTRARVYFREFLGVILAGLSDLTPFSFEMKMSDTETVKYDKNSLIALVNGLKPVSGRFLSNLKTEGKAGKHARLDLSDNVDKKAPVTKSRKPKVTNKTVKVDNPPVEV